MEKEDEIRHQMEDTRTALTVKLESLEKQVASSVQSATSGVTDTVDVVKETVQETVATVKDTVADTISTVRETVQGGVDAVKNLFDIPAHVENHPWAMMGGAVALGFGLGYVLSNRESETSAAAEQPHKETGPRYSTNGGRQHKSQTASAKASKQNWLSTFGPEISKLKGLALGALMGTVRDMLAKAVPQEYGAQLVGIIDGFTAKLGGEPITHESQTTAFQPAQPELRESRWPAK